MVNYPEPELPANPTDSDRIAAIRALLDEFDWELDDRQYALEAIERYVTPSDGQR